MDLNPAQLAKSEDEKARQTKRAALRDLNLAPIHHESSRLDTSLKRHTALIKRMRQSIGAEHHDQIIKDIDSLALEKYVDEIAGAAVEGVSRCKSEKDVWSAVEIISHMHRRFPTNFTPAIVSSLLALLSPPSRAALSTLPPEQREKEDAARVMRQRPVLRVCSELALVGVIRDGAGKSGAECMMKILKDLMSNDPTLSSMPLLSTFLKSYAHPYLGIVPPPSTKQIPSSSEPGTLSSTIAPSEPDGSFPPLVKEEEEFVEKDARDRSKRMFESYFDNVCKKLVIEHKRLQEQDRRNHEAYIRSGEIFEDRQQAYEKMTKGYEKLLSGCQTLSELLYLPLPSLPTASQKSDSIQIGISTSAHSGEEAEDSLILSAGKWEDEEERKFYEDIQDLKDFVPRSVLGIEETDEEKHKTDEEEKEKLEKAKAEDDVRKLEEELEGLKLAEEHVSIEVTPANGDAVKAEHSGDERDEVDLPTPTPGSPKPSTPPLSPNMAPQGPSQLLTALLARLPDATNRALIDQAAVDFSFLNSKAARKRLIRFLGQVPKNRTDLLPHYSRLVATLNRYMPDVGTELVAILDDEFRYLQKKKNVVKEFAETRLRNILYLANLTKFRVVPTHLILHFFKVCLDDFSGTNVENLALLLENCGRFLLRSDDTKERFAKMLELMRRKQSMQHFDQRQVLLLENAYYQCNPPERAPRVIKERKPMELFIRHLIYDVLVKKTIDKILKLVRKLDWDDPAVRHALHKVFTKPWKIKYGNISLLAMLTYDLQRYHPEFSVAVVDQVLEDVRRGLEVNSYNTNQRRLATMKFLGELYIYRLFSSGIVFDTLWSLVTFGHPDGRPLPGQPCPLDMLDDFFRVRLVCVLLDTCGMCFDRGAQRKKLDSFLTFFQYYICCKEPLPMEVDFMVWDSLEAVRPKMMTYKTIEEAAAAVDEMFNLALQNAGLANGDESGDESGDEDENRRDEEFDEEEEESCAHEHADGERAPSPEAVVILSAQENLGPSEEAEAEFAKELAKLVTDTSVESRKVDKKTALALLESAAMPIGIRGKKKIDDENEYKSKDIQAENDGSTMNFTVITKRGNKQQIRQIAVPAAAPLAVHTRSAQLQDKVEQQELKRLVLDYEHREELEEMKALEMRSRMGGIKIRYAT